MDRLQDTKLWTKDFILFNFANLFVGLTFYTLMTTMTMYAIQQFSASQSAAGLASSIFIIGALLARLVAGKSVEKVGRRKMMYVSLSLFFIVLLLYFFVDVTICYTFYSWCRLRLCEYSDDNSSYGCDSEISPW